MGSISNVYGALWAVVRSWVGSLFGLVSPVRSWGIGGVVEGIGTQDRCSVCGCPFVYSPNRRDVEVGEDGLYRHVTCRPVSRYAEQDVCFDHYDEGVGGSNFEATPGLGEKISGKSSRWGIWG
jgi:hypothetical protein